MSLITRIIPTPSDLLAHIWPLPYPTADFSGKTVIVTGASNGLGLEAARHFARLGAARLILACRDPDRGAAAQASIERSISSSSSSTTAAGPTTTTTTTTTSTAVEVWALDLASFASVRAFCARASAELDRVDVVVENAGLVATRFEPAPDAAGHETTVAVNVLSTFLLALLLLPLLRRTASRFNTTPRLVVVSSSAHFFTDLPPSSSSSSSSSSSTSTSTSTSIFEKLKTADGMARRYNISKLLQVLIVRELAARLEATGRPGLIINAVHPGFCRTNIFSGLSWPLRLLMRPLSLLLARSSEAGSRTLLAAAVAGDDSHGRYMANCVLADVSPWVVSEAGVRAQPCVFDDLMDILDGIQPGLSSSI